VSLSAGENGRGGKIALHMGREQVFKTPEGGFNYIDWGGSGPAAHLAHATGFCAEVYTPLADRLNARIRVLGMDDRGHGRTEVPADPRTLKGWDVFEADQEKFFEHLREPVIAMGHSRGGVASLLLAVKRPDLIRALILLDPTMLPLSWMWWWYLAKKTGLARFVPIAYRAARRQREWPDRETIFQVYKSKHSFRSWKEGFLEGYIKGGTRDTGHGTIELCCDPAWESRCFAVCPHIIWRYVPRIEVPTLLLYGADSDTFREPAVRRFRSLLPAASVKGFEGTGHFVPMERPDECASEILSFLEAHDIL
jgi:pimeloyl-ACP methyl ester carboxylesterase